MSKLLRVGENEGSGMLRFLYATLSMVSIHVYFTTVCCSRVMLDGSGSSVCVECGVWNVEFTWTDWQLAAGST